jgi:D-serine deaminase-like pyridoxal phosphate-dependent protein
MKKCRVFLNSAFCVLRSEFMITLSTPAFLVDLPTVSNNCRVMREKAAASGVHFRPHVKTHKTREIARLQHGGTAGAVTVSTLAEGESLADDGFRDITYAMPIAPEKLGRAAALAARIERLNVLVDSPEALRAIEAFHREHGVSFDVFLKVDCGYHRAGVDPDSPDSARLALALGRSDAVRFNGLLTHAGHSYNVASREEVARIAAEETAALTRFRAILGNELGLETLVRSVGSTPTLSVVDRFAACDEVRPGNYVFYDAFQAALGSCRPGDVAVSVLATVVGSYPERGGAIVDAGALALSKDSGPSQIDPACGYGMVCDTSLRPIAAKLVALSQEHGKLETRAHLPVGTKVRIVPNHSCLTAAMFDVYHVIDGGAVVDQWRPVRGW